MLSSQQIKHLIKNLKQRISPPTVGIIGGYHGGNLGDIALGMSVSEVLSQNNISNGLQTIYNLEKWRVSPYSIVGGGAVGYSSSLERVANRYIDNLGKVALLGVDFNEKQYSELCIKLINEAAYVSSRSKEQADRLKEITGRKDVFHHPDIAYSLMHDFCQSERKRAPETREKKLLVNVVPLYTSFTNGVLKPAEQYRAERPELYDNFDQMHASYKAVVRKIITRHLDEGYKVENLPFTPADKAYGEYLMSGLPVKHLAYSSEPVNVIKYMAKAQCTITTRFHATIFAIKLGLQLAPVAYAKKNELMLRDMGVPRESILSTTDLANGVAEPLDMVKVAGDVVDKAEMESLHAIQVCVAKVYQGK